MKPATRFLLSVIFFSLFVGCKTTYRATQPQIAEPTELENVLLVGRITIEFSEPRKIRAIRTFQTGSRQVLDLGDIRHIHGVSLLSTFEQSPEEGKNQTLFFEKFPESEWNQFTWSYKDMGGFPFLPQGI